MEGAAPASGEPAAPNQGETDRLKELFPGGLRVLLVDTDPLNRAVVEKMLRRCGYDGALPSVSAFYDVVLRALWPPRS